MSLILLITVILIVYSNVVSLNCIFKFFYLYLNNYVTNELKLYYTFLLTFITYVNQNKVKSRFNFIASACIYIINDCNSYSL